LRIANCETGNPPEGWESAGQLRIEKQGARRQNKKLKAESSKEERVAGRHGDGERRRHGEKDKGQKIDSKMQRTAELSLEVGGNGEERRGDTEIR